LRLRLRKFSVEAGKRLMASTAIGIDIKAEVESKKAKGWRCCERRLFAFWHQPFYFYLTSITLPFF
jgi:hypothetical protein